MKFKLYTIKDQLTGYGVPFADANDLSATRGFSNTILNDSLMRGNKKDFDLFRVGEYDTDTGKLVSCDPEIVYQASNLEKKE